MSKKISFIIISLVLAVLYTFLNKSPIDNPNSENVITIGMVTFPGYAPLYLAKEKGLFGDVDVNLVRIESIGDLRAAMKSGKIDIYIATPDIYQATDSTEPPGIGFLALDESHGADGIAVSQSISTVNDLKGKIIGAEPGFPPYFILQYVLNKEGLSLADVNFKDLTSQDAGNAFVAKALDAVGTYEPYLTKSIELRKGSKMLISSKDTEGLIVDYAFASESLIKNNPAVLEEIAKGWFLAVDYWQKKPDESNLIMAKAFGVSKDEMADFKTGVTWLTLEDNVSLFDPQKKPNGLTNFDLVGEILVSNESNGYRVFAKDKLTTEIISRIQ